MANRTQPTDRQIELKKKGKESRPRVRERESEDWVVEEVVVKEEKRKREEKRVKASLRERRGKDDGDKKEVYTLQRERERGERKRFGSQRRTTTTDAPLLGLVCRQTADSNRSKPRGTSPFPDNFYIYL